MDIYIHGNEEIKPLVEAAIDNACSITVFDTNLFYEEVKDAVYYFIDTWKAIEKTKSTYDFEDIIISQTKNHWNNVWERLEKQNHLRYEVLNSCNLFIDWLQECNKIRDNNSNA